ncbi:hypothetical protein Pla22_05810 [Rubripirellula amarantea]|uniref:Peptidase C-terminal archaeal/bacterial domain-containing protein n=1 Tax=Rubripirellula amarantea TaxID=2527999 RepID=A0A5C5WS86_9BACT|nr:ELWxxDGT repeat protein [Rubripirellula amarantea]TWT52953.1 hypothetical protein Pla22_05810 [Rubripirellula amarantea]
MSCNRRFSKRAKKTQRVKSAARLRFEVLEDRRLLAVDFSFLGDINAADYGASSAPQGFTQVGAVAFFTAETIQQGRELWKTDGTAAGTVLVKDVSAGSASGAAFGSNMLNVAGTLFFAAREGVHGYELWKSDGTEAGTTLVKDIRPGHLDASPKEFINVGGVLYFTANDGTHGTELWKSDGTSAGTVLVSDIRDGAAGSDPQWMQSARGNVFFSADDGSAGRELWVSDGTVTGTTMPLDIQTGAVGSIPTNLTEFGGEIFFTANDGTVGGELWKSDGTSAGTTLVADVRPGVGGSYGRHLRNLNGTLIFSAFDGTHGWEFWKSDGTTAGTQLVVDSMPGGLGRSMGEAVVVGNQIFAISYDSGGRELWKTDGTAAGTTMVADVSNGTYNTGPTLSAQLTNVGGTLYFSTNDGTSGYELWTSDGTALGTLEVADIYSGVGGSSPAFFADFGGTVLMRAKDSTHGHELWKSDGTVAGTTMVKDIRVDTLTSYPAHFAAVGDTLYFRANDATHGHELWKSDGTPAGTNLVIDLSAGSSNGAPKVMTEANGNLYFHDSGRLWKSDGTTAGTAQVVFTGGGFSNGAYQYDMFNFGGTLLFRGQGAGTGIELMSSDGTAAGTGVLADIRPGSGTSYPTQLTQVGGVVYFRANDGTNGYELWRTDGTTAGTMLVADVNPGAPASNPTNLTNVDGTLYFAADDGTNGIELWKTDGTAAGTVLVSDVHPGSSGSFASNLVNVSGTVYFRAYHASYGHELWKSDGTSAGTTVLDLNPGTASGFATSLTNVDGTLFFYNNDGVHGNELWTSDGTVAGSMMLADIMPGGASSQPGNFTNFGGELYFTAYDNEFGSSLWRSDGTAQGTERLSTSTNGSPQVRSTNGIIIAGNNMFIQGGSNLYGYELYLVTQSDPNDQIAEATTLASGPTSAAIDSLGGSGDVDLYRIDAIAGQAFDFDLDRPIGGLDAALRIFDSAGNQLAVSDNDAGPSPEFSSDEPFLHFVAPQNGTYYIGVSAASNVAYNAVDGRGDVSSTTLGEYQLILTNDWPAPVFNDESASTNADMPLVLPVIPAQYADEFAVLSATNGQHGTVTITGNGTLTYTPDLGFVGTDSFEYEVAAFDAEMMGDSSSTGDRFGYSIDISGDYAIVGAYLDDPDGVTNAGSALIYQRTGLTSWTEVAHLTGDLGAAGLQTSFGWSVAIDGDTAVVGAQYDRENGFRAGAAYVFGRNQGGSNQWGRVAKLAGSDTVLRDLFGRSVDISGDTIVVGASTADPAGSASGAAYVFNRDEGGVSAWGQVKKLIGSTTTTGDRFGQSVSIDNSTIAVGAFRHDGAGNDSGSVYLFKRNRFGVDNWGELIQINAADASANDQFGYSVSLDGSNLAIGAPLDDEAGMNQLGSVYVMSQNQGGVNQFGQVAKLFSDDGTAGDRLGGSVSLDGNRLAVGAVQSDFGGLQSGNAYLFEDSGTGWSQSRLLVNDEVTTADQYGVAVAIDGNMAAVGSWLDNRPDNNSGAAYAFDLQSDTATVTVTVIAQTSELPRTNRTSDRSSITSSSQEEPMDLSGVAKIRSASLTAIEAEAVDRTLEAFVDLEDDEHQELMLDDVALRTLTTKLGR